MFCTPPHPLTRARLAEGVRCTFGHGRAELVVRDHTAITVDDAAAVRLLAALSAGHACDEATGNTTAAERLLLAAGVLTVEFKATPGGAVVARLGSTGYAQGLRDGEPAADWRLHRHAVLRPADDGWQLSSPLSRYEMQFTRAELLERVVRQGPGATGSIESLIARALWAGALSESAADATGWGCAASWSFEDLLFHAASRRHADHRPRGKRLQRPDGAPPAPPAEPGVVLAKGLRRRLEAPSFEAVLAARRSVRARLPAPSRTELRDLLRAVQAERGSVVAPRRAYPMAGGVQALDFHLVEATRGGAMLFRFEAGSGALVRIDSPSGSAQRLLDEAAQSWGEAHGVPRALVVLTARLPELAARYEATAYRLALLEAGCATQLLTQTATALGLATCVLGNGDSELFALASGLPEWRAPAIAEIAIAGRL